MNKDNEYEVDWELTWKFAIEKNFEYQEEIADLKAIIEHYKNEKKLMKTQIKKLKAELSKYKKQYQHSMWFSDFWWYMEEDTN